MEILDQPTSTDMRVASDTNRIVAYLIDCVILIPLWLIPFVGIFAGVIYYVTRDALPFLDGQSIGKKIMKIRAVTEDGRPLTNNYGPCIIRNIVLLIPFFPLIELIVLLTNENKQRLGDQWAKTKVIAVD